MTTIQDHSHPDRLSHLLPWTPDKISKLLITAKIWYTDQLHDTNRLSSHNELVKRTISQCTVLSNDINNVNIIYNIGRCLSDRRRGVEGPVLGSHL